MRSLFGGSSPAADVYAHTASGIRRHNWIELPEHAERVRLDVRSDIGDWAELESADLRERMLESGYLVPHWPKPWGRAADPVEQLIIEQELVAAEIKRPDLSITGWVMLTLVQCGTPDQIARFVEPALRGEQVWCQLFSEPGAGSDAAPSPPKRFGWRVVGVSRVRRYGPAWRTNATWAWLRFAPIRTRPSTQASRQSSSTWLRMALTSDR